MKRDRRHQITGCQWEQSHKIGSGYYKVRQTWKYYCAHKERKVWYCHAALLNHCKRWMTPRTGVKRQIGTRSGDAKGDAAVEQHKMIKPWQVTGGMMSTRKLNIHVGFSFWCMNGLLRLLSHVKPVIISASEWQPGFSSLIVCLAKLIGQKYLDKMFVSLFQRGSSGLIHT